jgi:hypothetical protein
LLTSFPCVTQHAVGASPPPDPKNACPPPVATRCPESAQLIPHHIAGRQLIDLYHGVLAAVVDFFDNSSAESHTSPSRSASSSSSLSLPSSLSSSRVVNAVALVVSMASQLPQCWLSVNRDVAVATMVSTLSVATYRLSTGSHSDSGSNSNTSSSSDGSGSSSSSSNSSRSSSSGSSSSSIRARDRGVLTWPLPPAWFSHVEVVISGGGAAAAATAWVRALSPLYFPSTRVWLTWPPIHLALFNHSFANSFIILHSFTVHSFLPLFIHYSFIQLASSPRAHSAVISSMDGALSSL